MLKPKESDWKTFRKRVPEWRERYLLEKNHEIVSVLSEEGRTPTERFWDTKEKIDEEAKILVRCLDGHSRSKMFKYLLLMYGYGLVQNADLYEFSDELREWIQSSSA